MLKRKAKLKAQLGIVDEDDSAEEPSSKRQSASK
jgi:hypothetical protein